MLATRPELTCVYIRQREREREREKSTTGHLALGTSPASIFNTPNHHQPPDSNPLLHSLLVAKLSPSAFITFPFQFNIAMANVCILILSLHSFIPLMHDVAIIGVQLTQRLFMAAGFKGKK